MAIGELIFTISFGGVLIVVGFLTRLFIKNVYKS